MEENLAANSRDFATPDGAANIGEGAPLPAAANAAAPAESAPMEIGDGREWTRKVAQRIKDERQKAQSELITELFGSEDAYTAYRENREQERLSAEDLRESSLFAELALAADPHLGEHYLALQDEVQELSEAYGTDMESAFLLVLRQHLPQLLREERIKGEQELLVKLSANATTPGSLADAAAPPAGLNVLNDAEFAAMVARVKRGEFRN